MEDENLIERVRKYTFIYEPTEKGHADIRLLKNARREISRRSEILVSIIYFQLSFDT